MDGAEGKAASGYLHHRAFADSIAEIGDGTVHQAIATSIILLLILIPFFAFCSLAEAVGGRVAVSAVVRAAAKP